MSRVIPLMCGRPQVDARALASSELGRRIRVARMTQESAGALVRVDARQVRRWLSGDVSLGPLELYLVLDRLDTSEAA